MRICEETTSYI